MNARVRIRVNSRACNGCLSCVTNCSMMNEMFVSLTPARIQCERIFNLERAIQVRNYQRQRSDDETLIPYFERIEWWENPYIGEKKRLVPEKFRMLLDRYYLLRGWDLEKGRPNAAKLRQLGFEDVAWQLSQAGLLATDTMQEDVYV